ncbi:MAG: 16S rRNA (cytidine(1402)-2'-O)-methyltransferase [Alphaproteobacteria bacterium]|nr:16S rRNA (cytidine(1402)-2'-O)-methyltransferase [Alphaproteobacteria bacterium]
MSKPKRHPRPPDSRERQTKGEAGATQSQPHDSPKPFAPGLYLVSTPIGHARDITLRALDLLRTCDLIVAEDTRVTAKLLSLHGISKPMQIFNDHNAPKALPPLLARLKDGAVVGLVSDAGTPLISDPGFRLARAAIEAGVPVIPLPGPSALLAALVASNLPVDRFAFLGFLPPKAASRRAALIQWRDWPLTLVFYEAPQRLADTLATMTEVLGPREAVIARELTKRHEEFRRARLDDLAREYAGAPPLGEIVLIVGPPLADAKAPAIDLDTALRGALKEASLKEAVARVAAETGLPRKEVYARALHLTRRAP